jgi:hypothetical protein
LKNNSLSSIENSEKLLKNIDKISCVVQRQPCKTIEKAFKEYPLSSIESIEKH